MGLVVCTIIAGCHFLEMNFRFCRFKEGTRIDYLADGEWRCGTILCSSDSLQIDVYDSGREFSIDGVVTPFFYHETSLASGVATRKVCGACMLRESILRHHHVVVSHGFERCPVCQTSPSHFCREMLRRVDEKSAAASVQRSYRWWRAGYALHKGLHSIKLKAEAPHSDADAAHDLSVANTVLTNR